MISPSIPDAVLLILWNYVLSQELFLFVNEMRNFTAVLKDLLDLGNFVVGVVCEERISAF